MSFDLRAFALRYTAAWNSQDPAQVAACYSPGGCLRVNDAEPAAGRDAIAAVAQSFMTSFPDMQVLMDGLQVKCGRTLFRWTLIGTNTGPGGTGHRVHISGYEDWRMGEDGLILESLGHFDSEEYQRQLAHGAHV
jgi:nuclear transport factor 2 (NTF2) superfamily protein